MSARALSRWRIASGHCRRSSGMALRNVGTYGGLAGVGPGTVEGGVAGHGAAERSLGDAGDGHCV